METNRLNANMFKSVQDVASLDMRLSPFDCTVKVHQCLALGLDLGIAPGNYFPFQMLEFRGSKSYNARSKEKHAQRWNFCGLVLFFPPNRFACGVLSWKKRDWARWWARFRVGRSLVSLCLVFCVFVMSLAVSLCLSMGAFGEVGMVLCLCAWGYATIMVGKTDSLSQFWRIFVSYFFDTRVLNGKADSDICNCCHQTQHGKRNNVFFGV